MRTLSIRNSSKCKKFTNPNKKMTSNNSSSINQSINKEEEEACQYALELCNSSTLLMVMKAAIELDLFEIIAKNNKISASNIATLLPTTQNIDKTTYFLERMLHLLATYSLLTCTTVSTNACDGGKVENKLYGLAPAGKYYVKDDRGGSLAQFFTFQLGKPLMDLMYHCKDAVLNGHSAWKETHKMPIEKYMEMNPLVANHFHTGMSEFSATTMRKLLETYKGFEGLNSLVDIGGGNGTTLNMIISKYPCIKGINFDLPHVIEHAPSYKGIEHVGGNMFEGVPKGDAILIKSVLHNWDDESSQKLLMNCCKVLPKEGKVIIVELILPTFPVTSHEGKFVSLIDNVMVSTVEGKERTRDEFMALCKSAGFSKLQVICASCAHWAIEVYK